MVISGLFSCSILIEPYFACHIQHLNSVIVYNRYLSHHGDKLYFDSNICLPNKSMYSVFNIYFIGHSKMLRKEHVVHEYMMRLTTMSCRYCCVM